MNAACEVAAGIPHASKKELRKLAGPGTAMMTNVTDKPTARARVFHDKNI
jgi:hypothetical protein